MDKIGVFVCHCGSNIKAVVDIAAVLDAARKMGGVCFAAEYPYLCASAGQELIGAAIAEHGLTGIVVAACSPRMHEPTFRKAAEKAGLNPFMVEIANIREQCSWVHKDAAAATEKAIVLARAAVAKVLLNAPLFPGQSAVTKRALVVGGGIAGIQTALDIAEAGFAVDIVESTPSIGGKMAQLDKTFPTLDCAACILTPKMVEVSNHDLVNLYTYSEIEKVEGFVGDFSVTIRKKARSVCLEKCTGCGDCWAKCPLKRIPSEFDAGIGNRAAIYTPFAQAVPNVPAIDRATCLKFKNGRCGLCVTVCQPNAIDFEEQDELVVEKYGAIVMATGFDMVKPDKFGEYGYAENPDVVTSLEFERITNAAGPTNGQIIRLSDGKKPRSIAFIQCVGSRDTTERGRPYCSKICCMYTAKHAIAVKEKYPDIDVSIFYIDVRTPGKNFDEFYRRAAEKYGVKYIKGQVGKIVAQGGVLRINAVDMLANSKIELDADMVVLAMAIEAAAGNKTLASKLAASIDTNKWMTEAHPKLRPVESPTAGIYLSGVCQGPKDIPETVAQAGAAAAKVIGLLAKDALTTNPCTAAPNPHYCNGCAMCENLCPYGAISYEIVEINDHGRKSAGRAAQVNDALCQGCGACVVTCPSGAMDLKGFSNRQLIAEIDAIIS